MAMAGQADSKAGAVGGIGRRVVEAIVAGCGALAITAAVAMLLATVYDVGARYFLNSPTVWATEISTYLLIALVFLGAGSTQLANANVRVDVLLARLSLPARATLEAIGAWIALLTIALMAWQAVLQVGNDWMNGARIFSLLLTPSWLPKTPIAIGLVVLVLAMLLEMTRSGITRAQRVAPWLIAALVVAVLVAFGAKPPNVPGTPFDMGSALVLLAVWVCAGLVHGRRAAAWVIALTAGAAVALLGARDAGFGVLCMLLGVAIVLYLAIGVRIAFAMAFVGLLAVYFLLPRPFPLTLADRTWSSVNSFALTAVPLFVLMGAVLVRSGLSDQLFTLMARLLSRLPGGLAHAGTAGCAVFAAVSGSSVATAATIGTVACPEMIRRGYSERLTYGSIAAGGTLGILIPPSVPMIIYGTTVGVPVATLFIAGIIPGLLMMLLFMAVILVWAILAPGAAPRESSAHREPLSPSAILDVVMVVLLVALTILSLYLGVATPSETAAVGAFLALVLSALRGRVSIALVRAAFEETVTVTSFIFLIIVGANLVTFGFDYLKLSQLLMSAATDATVDRWMIFLIVVLVYVVLGMFLDSISMLVLTLPVVFPLMKQLGFDPVWFGIILVIMAEIGLITPPVGMNLFVLQGIGRGVSLRTIAIGALPFLLAMLVTVLLLCIEPDIALWLTRAMS
ncbi:MAG: TRAP transporter large permease subunit [Burkholderiales bacterium]